MTDFVLLGTFVIVLPLLNWLSVLVLWFAHRRRPELRWLRERGIAATLLALASTAGGLIFIDAIHADSLLDADTLAVMAAMFLFLVSLPALYWLWLYIVRGLPDEKED